MSAGCSTHFSNINARTTRSAATPKIVGTKRKPSSLFGSPRDVTLDPPKPKATRLAATNPPLRNKNECQSADVSPHPDDGTENVATTAGGSHGLSEEEKLNELVREVEIEVVAEIRRRIGNFQPTKHRRRDPKLHVLVEAPSLANKPQNNLNDAQTKPPTQEDDFIGLGNY
ncbi:hypothetical protein Pelo_9896 [Pelomyxa schiedti]|nr:hypothetical protein Pelo_9896 [Pelomyxa schiedti]